MTTYLDDSIANVTAALKEDIFVIFMNVFDFKLSFLLHIQVVAMLLERLAAYNSTAVPPCQLEDDPDGANPDNNSGAWMPWLESRNDFFKRNLHFNL